MTAAVPLARVIRSGLEESVHLGHVAVYDAAGDPVATAGDPSRPVFARSCMKPLQAAVSLRAIDENLPDEVIAVMCASHNGEPIHVRTVRRLLARGGLAFSALRCPPMWPMDQEARARADRPRRELGDCSGKHAGMLVASVRAGWDPASYLRPSHPLQRRILRAVLRATDQDEVAIGVDGCGVPVHGMPLAALATLYARFADPERFGDLAGQMSTCAAAMRAAPYLVAGRNRTDTAVMREAPGLIVKSGAEGLACAAIVDAGLGVAVKVADGGGRASGPALVRALALLGALTEAQLVRLSPFGRRPVTGGGDRVGDVVSDFRLRRARS